MQLKSHMLTMEIDGTYYVVPAAAGAYPGIGVGNETAGFILEQLKQPVTEEALVNALCAEFDAPREQIAADAAEFLAALREMDALEE